MGPLVELASHNPLHTLMPTNQWLQVDDATGEVIEWVTDSPGHAETAGADCANGAVAGIICVQPEEIHWGAATVNLAQTIHITVAGSSSGISSPTLGAPTSRVGGEPRSPSLLPDDANTTSNTTAVYFLNMTWPQGSTYGRTHFDLVRTASQIRCVS